MPELSTTPWRALPAARRIAILTRLCTERKEARALYIQRLIKRGGGYRAATLLSWPAERLVKEVVRLNAQTAEDEIDLLQALYVDLEPAVQTTFLTEAGVKRDGASIDESLTPPFCDAAAVQRAAAKVRAEHGEDGVHYLKTIARYNPVAWPGIEDVAASL